jgi:FkbM family methyltransferase
VPFTISKALQYRRSASDFFRDSGGELLLHHDLGPQSFVLDVGAYVGDWTSEIVARYGAEVIAFEPLPCYYGALIRRFEQTEQVRVRGYGLAEASGRASMGMAQMGSSEFLKKNRVPVIMRDVAEVFEELGGREVDLMKVNIEGGEYKLLERMLQKDLLRNVRKLMVQFHEQWPSRRESRPRRQSLVERIELTHDPEFTYPFVWECWVRKPDTDRS